MNGNMALSQITDNIWLGSIMSLKAERSLKERGVTHILSVLGPIVSYTDSQTWAKLPIFQQMKSHLIVEVEDLDDVDILEHLEKTNDFIQHAIDAKEGVLVHCAAGISRSVTCVCAYLMKAHKWTPAKAIDYVRSRREVANPNDGFRAQLEVYYNCGFAISLQAKPYREWKLEQLATSGSTISKNHIYTQVNPPPLTVTWKHVIPALIKKAALSEVKPSDVHQVAIDTRIYSITEPVITAISSRLPIKLELLTDLGRIAIAPSQLGEVLTQIVTRLVSYRCKGCATTLASSSSLVRHPPADEGTCQHHFLEPVEWMRPELELGELEGKLACPKCRKKVGSYLWQGSRCSCGKWVIPSFKLSKAKVDEMASTSRPLL